MPHSKTITIKHRGPVLLEQSPMAKRLNVSIKPTRGVRVAVPKGVSFRTAKKFLLTKIDWIKYHLDRIKKHEQQKSTQKLPPINRTKARLFLVNRLNQLSSHYGYNYNKVFIRNQRTRWGSCSVKNNINLNMNLVRLPEELIDYVILHELVHIKHKNHSKKFWEEMDKLVGDGKKMQRRMRGYRIG